MDERITISEAARRLGHPDKTYRVLVLVAECGIEVQRVGTALAMNSEGFERLAEAFKDWERRHRRSLKLKTSQPADSATA